jgi:hypothetical protein
MLTSKEMLPFLNDSITKISQAGLEVHFLSLFEILHRFLTTKHVLLS